MLAITCYGPNMKSHIMEVLTICLICYSASMKSHAIWRAAHDIEGVNLAYDSLVWIDF